MIKEGGVRSDYRKIELSNGFSVSYSDEGKGAQTILFIHGLATYGGTWAQNIAGLRGSYRCIAVDLPGNGYSDKPDTVYNMQFYAACIYDFIHLLKLKNVVLCGHSMGGQVALTLLLNAPDVAQKLVLCAPAGFERFNVFEKTMYRSVIGVADLFSSDESSLRSSIYSSFYQNPSQADGMIAEMVKILHSYPARIYRKMVESSVDGMLNEPVYEQLDKIKVPVLVIFGELDALIPNKLLHPVSTEHMARQATAKMQHARLEMVPFAGHFVQWEKASAVNQLIASFLEETV
jgi:pimeloyl-ACP methyl ester carboxylesterase